jgi:sugar/nucleoside kinase (ribokinase family)
VLAQKDDAFLKTHTLDKGGMRLIDKSEAETLYKAMQGGQEISGGSAANTINGLAALGLSPAFIGKVRNDALGDVFARDLTASGVYFKTPAQLEGESTARCLVLVTPDGERTMSTYLGAAQNLTPKDVDADVVGNSNVVYLEGYLWDPTEAKQAFLKAAEIAHAQGKKVALSLSDAFCVNRYRQEFLDLLRNKHVDLVFANASEAMALYETQDYDMACASLRQDATLAIVTNGAMGASAFDKESVISVPAFTVQKVVDTTGAGDLFAAGFLAGYCRQMGLEQSLRLGALLASEVISHIGARPVANLKTLAKQQGFAL